MYVLINNTTFSISLMLSLSRCAENFNKKAHSKKWGVKTGLE